MDSKTSDKLHAAIMNLPARGPRGTIHTNDYLVGHRDARHAAAELVLAARSEEMAALRAVLMRTANALDSATHFVSKEKGVMPMLEVLAAARAALTPTEKTE